MTRMPIPNLTAGETKTGHVEEILKAAEAARQLHNALNQMKPIEYAYRDDVQYGVAKVAWQERLDAVERLEGELLEHAMRVTLG